jgi:PTS system nitrogen regulatory IIA component
VTRLLFFIAPSPRAHLELLGSLTRVLNQGRLAELIVRGASDAEIRAALAAGSIAQAGAAGRTGEERQ